MFWFIVCQWIIASGTIFFIDPTRDDEILYAILFLLAIVFFMLGSSLRFYFSEVSRLHGVFFKSEIERDTSESTLLFYIVAIVASLATFSYYNTIGYNLLLDVILGKDILDFVSARLATYSGDTYYAPGYVNQFKNALLPLCGSLIVVFILSSFKSSIKYLLIVTVIFGLLLALMGTGQRAPMVYALTAVIFSVSLVQRLPLKLFVIIGFVALMIFGGFSVLLLRTDDGSLLGSILSVLIRIFMVEQTEGILSFKYIASIEYAYMYEWLEGFLGISPWHKGSYLAHQTFEHLHGTDRGTSGVSLVASAYHNGGIPLVVAFYFFVGYLFSSTYLRFLSGRRTLLRCFGYGHIFFIFSVFVSSAPIFLVNKGLLMFMLILIIRKVRFRNAFRIPRKSHKLDLV